MIVSSLQDYGRILALHPLFKPLFDYVSQADLPNLGFGRHIILNDELFINNINPECVSQEEQMLEIHRDYIDVHILLSGEERIGWKPLNDVGNMVKPYSKEEDCALYKEPATTYIDLLPGQFAIMFPEDAHAPIIGTGKIWKIIGKVRIDNI